MSESIRVEVDDTAVLARLEAIRVAGANLRPAMASIGRKLKSNVQLGFRAGIDPYGRPWKDPKGRDGEPLVDSGRLRDSIDYDAGDDQVTIGTNVRYAGVHQFGATIHAKNKPYLMFRMGQRWVRKKQVTIPQRMFLPTDGLPEDWRDDVLDVLSRHLLGAGQ